MKYFTLAADYMEFSLRDEQVGPVSISDLSLPVALIDDLRDWNSRYQAIIPKSLDERCLEQTASLIEELDLVGLALADRVAEAISGGAKVRYYSEGLLKHLP